MNWNLRNKFLIPTILITIVAFAVTIYVTYSQTQQNMRHQIEKELEQVAKLSAMHLQSWVEGVQQDITNWAALAEIQTVVETPEKYQASLDLLSTFKEKYGYYETILIANNTGEIIGSAREEDIGKINVADRAYFKQSLSEKSVISEVIQSRLTGNPVFVVTQQIQTESEMGMILGVVDLNYFSQSYINPIKIGEEGYAYVMDQHGLVIAHPNPDLIMEINIVEDYDFGKKL
ncbi:MAG: hypothetical protein GF372_10865, partial [Candidatus Marinimicrobia bacterium]|nr:hypothetical protein [Candidatus Neomarinimicrobiota bacterium]